jgi:nucleoside diphosphate kinase
MFVRNLKGFGIIGVLSLSGLSYAISSPSQAAQCSAAPSERNSAFVFIKPQANNKLTQAKVAEVFKQRGIEVKAQGEITAEKIDEDMLIDQHYYAIASKATLLKPAAMPVPKEKFKESFGIEWEQALKDGVVFNAIDACRYLGIDGAGLEMIWRKANPVKFGGGFYCGKIEPNIPGKHKAIYVFNGFFMSMRNKFVTPGLSIHYYVVDFDPKTLSWADFRGKVLGPTNPKDAPKDSLRGSMLANWKELGMDAEPTVGDNCVHASASPFEGLAEKMNWLKVQPQQDEFGIKMIQAGISPATLKEWSIDPLVGGKSLFDQLEDLDVEACVAKAQVLNAKK